MRNIQLTGCQCGCNRAFDVDKVLQKAVTNYELDKVRFLLTEMGADVNGSSHGYPLIESIKASRDEFEGIAEGIGPGGSIQKMMFDPNHQSRVYTCSIDGTFELKDLGKKGLSKKETFLNTHNWEKWYTSFDIAPDGMTLITGENSGS